MDKASGSGAISPEGYSRGAATVGRSQGGVQGGPQGGAVARPSLPSAADGLLAALDLGTNNCRLLIAKAAADCAEADGPLSDPGFTVIRPVRLGEDIERTGSLSRSAQDRAIKALRICASKLRQRRVAASRIVATEACR
ncbi:MAG: hypothetical protein AAGG47_17795, partial [Pseudomonadota bacterium]